MHTPNRFPQQVCHRQDGELGEESVLLYGDGVGDDHLLEQTAGKTLYGWGAAGRVTKGVLG